MLTWMSGKAGQLCRKEKFVVTWEFCLAQEFPELCVCCIFSKHSDTVKGGPMPANLSAVEGSSSTQTLLSQHLSLSAFHHLHFTKTLSSADFRQGTEHRNAAQALLACLPQIALYQKKYILKLLQHSKGCLRECVISSSVARVSSALSPASFF